MTKADVDRAVTSAKKTLVEKYDLNGNGLPREEINKMSLTDKRAVELAKALEAAAVPDAPPRIEEGFSEPEEIAAAGPEAGRSAPGLPQARQFQALRRREDAPGGGQTLYLEKLSSGKLRLAIQQING